MFRSRSWFFSSSSSGSLWKPKNPHSTEYLKYLHSVLVKNGVVCEGNKGLLVEALRSIAEILIWGDQNDPTVFDFFLEKQMLSFFLSIMRQSKSGSYVTVQLLQTLNILFENIRNQTSVYYLLSNNHVNSIIEHKFDFSDEEVMAYYISFLKTLSFKLNSSTIHFFFNEHTHDFPLYTEAIKFFNNPESMVRIAVRTLTLNVFRVQDKSMLEFIRDKTAAPYFSNLVWFIGGSVGEIDRLVKEGVVEGGPTPSHPHLKLNDLLAENLDHLHYLNDILLLNHTHLNTVLVDHLLNRLIKPVVIASLLGTPPESTDHTPSKSPLPTKISKILSLYLLTEIYCIVTYPELLKELTVVLETVDLEEFYDCSESDYAAFFGVALVTGVLGTTPLPVKLQPRPELLLSIISNAVTSPTKVRLVTLSLATELLKLNKLSDGNLATLESYREVNIADLLSWFKGEELFLELFEDEFGNTGRGWSLGGLLNDSCMLLAPVGSPLCGVGLERRRPCGETERIRRSMRIYFILRSTSLKLRGEVEKYLPLSNIHRNLAVALEQVLDLTNSDLLACTVVTKETKLRRFLVVDSFQVILVEPSQKRMGWGVVKFVGFLQDMDIQTDPTDPRSLQITIKSSPIKKTNKEPLLAARFIFDDHIRCMAARQRLTKGRHRAREKKLTLISRILNDNLISKYSPPQNLRSLGTSRYSQLRALPGGVVVVPSSAASGMSTEVERETSVLHFPGSDDAVSFGGDGVFHV